MAPFSMWRCDASSKCHGLQTGSSNVIPEPLSSLWKGIIAIWVVPDSAYPTGPVIGGHSVRHLDREALLVDFWILLNDRLFRRFLGRLDLLVVTVEGVI